MLKIFNTVENVLILKQNRIIFISNYFAFNSNVNLKFAAKTEKFETLNLLNRYISLNFIL